MGVHNYRLTHVYNTFKQTSYLFFYGMCWLIDEYFQHEPSASTNDTIEPEGIDYRLRNSR